MPSLPNLQTICGIHAQGFASLEKAAFLKPWSASAFSQTSVRAGWYLGPSHEPHAFLYMQVIAGEAEILRIATHPNQRRLGHAQTLWQQFLKHPFHPIVDTVFLEVSALNLGAKKFYTALGFETSGLRPNYYQPGEDAELMTWKR